VKYQDFNDVFKKYSLQDLTPAHEAAALEQVTAIDRANKEWYKAWSTAHSALIIDAQMLYGKDSVVVDYLRKHRISAPPVAATAWSAWIRKVRAHQQKEVERQKAEQEHESALVRRRARASYKRQLQAEHDEYVESTVSSD